MVIIFKRSALCLAMFCIYQQSSAEMTPISKKTSVEARSDTSITTSSINNKAEKKYFLLLQRQSLSLQRR